MATGREAHLHKPRPEVIIMTPTSLHNIGTSLSTQTVANIGLYYVCYRLSRFGWNAMPTARNARGVDIVIYNEDASKKLTIQVKALSRHPGVPLGKDLDHLFANFVVVCTDVATPENPNCYVMTSQEVRSRMVHNEKNGKASHWLPYRAYASASFREKWKRIGA